MSMRTAIIFNLHHFGRRIVYRLSAIAYRLSLIAYRLSLIGYRLSLMPHRTVNGRYTRNWVRRAT